MELFDLLEQSIKNNCIETIPLNSLASALREESDTDYTIMVSSAHNILLSKKNSDGVINVGCIRRYYDFDLNNKSISDMGCGEIKSALRNIEVEGYDSFCNISCAKCHLHAINEYNKGNATKLLNKKKTY